MRNRIIIIIVSLVIVILPASAQKGKFATTEDSLSYALGVANLKYYQKDSIPINAKLFIKGMGDASKDESVMTDSVANAFIVKYMQALQVAEKQKQYKAQIEEANRFLAENGKKEGVVTMPSGLQYKVITEGTGDRPGTNDIVVVHYKGTTINGAKFDSSYDRGEPARFRLSNVIRGWTEGLQLMPAGSKYLLYIPSDLAYGERGAGSVIKPFETLIFEVELLEVIKE